MIKRFRGKYSFLSNFFTENVVFEGSTYRTAEHAYQASKCANLDDKQKIMHVKNASMAKKLGRQCRRRANWENIKDIVMEKILKAKFENPKLRKLLDDTKSQKLLEENRWHDRYWGTCICTQHHNMPGKNKLGILLMKIRTTPNK